MKTPALLAIAGIPFCFLGAQEAIPGLSLTIEGQSGNKDVHSVELPAMYVPLGEPASPFVNPGSFQATWEGFLNLDSRSRLYFSFSGIGKATLKVDGETILEVEGDDLSKEESERHRLNSGQHSIELKYKSPHKGAAQFRLNWRGRDFAKETVPAKVFTRQPILLGGDKLRKGRNLVARSGCIQCHKADRLDKNLSMPELGQDAPTFEGIGLRLEKYWMASWIQNPASHRTSPRMPSLVGNHPPAAALHIAEWLSQKKGNETEGLPPATEKSIGAGEQLFHSMGCLACHDKDAGNSPKYGKNQRIALSNAGHKFKPGALRDFLLDPDKHYKWIRMPDFSFSKEEATQLSHYLRSIQRPRPPGVVVVGEAAKGFEYAKQTGCMNCHEPDADEQLAAPALSALDTSKGCLSPAPGKLPDYGMGDPERSAIREFLAKAQPSLGKRSIREFAHRQVSILQCNACHPMRGNQPHLASLPDLTTKPKHAPGDIDAAAHAAGLKKGPPDLTLSGEKLRTAWMEQLFTGKLAYKPRPWMKMRMPSFHARGNLLANGLAAYHGFSPSPEQPGKVEGWSETGQQLISPNGGFACVACHAVGEKAALAPFEGQGLNFTYSRDRLTHEWYLRWMLNPQRLSPQSIMPRYSDEEGYSTLTDVLEGNATDQFNAIWQYFQNGKDL